MSNRSYEATPAATAKALFSVEDIAKETANPKLFLRKYSFYVNTLHFSPDVAVRWAKRSVRVNNEVRVALSNVAIK
jgi:hypothetical protein